MRIHSAWLVQSDRERNDADGAAPEDALQSIAVSHLPCDHPPLRVRIAGTLLPEDAARTTEVTVRLFDDNGIAASEPQVGALAPEEVDAPFDFAFSLPLPQIRFVHAGRHWCRVSIGGKVLKQLPLQVLVGDAKVAVRP